MIVTHDIEEAIKLADRVAIMNVGGVLEQYATPDELLSEPSSEFVASFLGRERGLRRLALRTVADIEPIVGPTVDADADLTVAKEAMGRFGTPWVAVVHDGRLTGWVGRDAIERGEVTAVGELPAERFVSRVHPTTPLREALDVIVNAHSRMAVVVDTDEHFVGMITIDEVAGGLEA